MSTHGSLRRDRKTVLTDNPFLLAFVIMAIICASWVLVFWSVEMVINVVPDAERGKIASASLVASSILFGFATTSLLRLSAQLMDVNQILSDVAKELVDVYGSVKNNEHLRSKRLRWKMKVWNYGRAGYGCKAPALEAISDAYRHLLASTRFGISFARGVVYLFYITSLCFLIWSIFTSLLAHITGGFQERLLYGALASLVSATLLTLAGWIICNRIITQIVDSLFNVRHYIHGGIADVLPWRD